VKWRYRKQVPEISSPVIVDGQIYFVSGNGVATSLRLNDGSLVWQHRLEGGYMASPIAGDGKIYFTNQDGRTTVVKPGAEYVELNQNQLVGRTMASLSVADGSLLIRTDRRLYCIGKKSADTFTIPFGLP
jgi:outer membrane protein assembly factor BamB